MTVIELIDSLSQLDLDKEIVVRVWSCSCNITGIGQNYNLDTRKTDYAIEADTNKLDYLYD